MRGDTLTYLLQACAKQFAVTFLVDLGFKSSGLCHMDRVWPPSKDNGLGETDMLTEKVFQAYATYHHDC